MARRTEVEMQALAARDRQRTGESSADAGRTLATKPTETEKQALAEYIKENEENIFRRWNRPILPKVVAAKRGERLTIKQKVAFAKKKKGGDVSHIERIKEAILRSDLSTWDKINLVDHLDELARPPGKPRKLKPSHVKLQIEFNELRDQGTSVKAAHEILAAKHRMEETSVLNALKRSAQPRKSRAKRFK